METMIINPNLSKYKFANGFNKYIINVENAIPQTQTLP